MIEQTFDRATREGLPDTPEAWLANLSGPLHLRVPGRDGTRARAFVTLLHGNEPSGFRALHGWLRAGATPAVDLHAFVLSVEAAKLDGPFGHRMLPGAPDLNRCFVPDSEAAMASALLDALRAVAPEAVVDVHNTSGASPAYGISTRAAEAHYALASLFSTRLILTDIRLDSLMEATQDEFPTVTIECGGSRDPAAHAVARRGLQAFAERDSLDAARPRPRLLQHPVRVELARDLHLAFAEHPEPDADLTLRPDIDQHNFDPVHPGDPLGWLGPRGLSVLRARATDGRDLIPVLFAADPAGVLTVRAPTDLLMVTTDVAAALSDCLFYAVPPGP